MSEETSHEKSFTNHKILQIQPKPFQNKRRLFGAAFGTSKKARSTNGDSTSTEEQSSTFNSESFSRGNLDSPKPIHLWSSPRPETNSSVSSKVSRLDLDKSVSSESISNRSGYISQRGNFHAWGSDQSRFGTPTRRNRPKVLKPEVLPKDKEDRFKSRFHSEAAKEVMASLERLARPVGPDHITFEEFKRNKPPRNEVRDPRPYGWRRNNRGPTETTTMGTQTLSQPKPQTRPTSNGISEPVSEPILEKRKNKMKRERTKMRETKSVVEDEQPLQPEYDLGNVPTISVDSKISFNTISTPKKSECTISKEPVPTNEKPRCPASPPRPKPNTDYPLIDPNKKESSQTSSSQPDQEDFSFSQPNTLNTLIINSQSETSNVPSKKCDFSVDKSEPPKEKPKLSFEKRDDPIPDVHKASKNSKEKEEKLNIPKTEKAPSFNFNSNSAAPPNVTVTPSSEASPSGFGEFLSKQKTNPEPKKSETPKSDAPKFSFGQSVEKEDEKPVSTPAIPKPTMGGFGDLLAKQKKASAGKWSCDICMVSNDASASKCAACETPNPNAPAPTASASSKEPEAPKFTFGVPSNDQKPAATPATSFMGFGSAPPKPTPIEPTKVEPVAKTAPVTTAPTTSGFGDFMAKQKAASASKWSCDICMVSNDASAAKCLACETPNPNAPKPTQSSEPTSAPKFVFGVSEPAKTAEEPKTTPSFSFGAPAKTEPTPTPSLFGSQPSSQPKVEKSNEQPKLKRGRETFSSEPKKTAFSFGAKPSDTLSAPKPATPTSSFSFGASKPTEPAQKQKPSFSFGQPTPAPTPAVPQTTSLFGQSAPSTDSAPKFSFGQKTEEKPASGFSFGAPTNTETPKPTTSIFGASAPVPTSTAPSFSFGAPKPTETQKPASSGGFAFGSTNPSGGSIFGKPEEKPASSTMGFNFGATAKPEPAKSGFSFGATNQPANPIAGSSLDSKPSFSFGAEPSKPSVPSFGGFGATNNTQPPPNTSSSIFQPSQPTSMFGSNDNGKSSFNFSNNTPASEPFTFGASAPANNQPSGGSIFGAQQTQPPQQSSMFGNTQSQPMGFGSTQQSSFQPSGDTGFSFGQTSSQPPSFGSQPNNFAPQQTQSNMFNPAPNANTPTANRKIARARRRKQN